MRLLKEHFETAAVNWISVKLTEREYEDACEMKGLLMHRILTETAHLPRGNERWDAFPWLPLLNVHQSFLFNYVGVVGYGYHAVNVHVGDLRGSDLENVSLSKRFLQEKK